MKCFKPIKIISNDFDGKEYYPFIYVPCGKCEACRCSDANSWRIRLKEHFYDSVNAYFVTLTYSDDNIPFKVSADKNIKGFFPSVNKQDVQKFFKRLRENFKNFYTEDFKFSYFLVSEYGPTTLRPHYHAILFNLPILSPIDEIQNFKITQAIQEIWNLGFIKLDKCNENRIAYCTKYMSCETFIPSYLNKPFRLISHGIGKSYLSKSERIIWHKKGLNNYYPDGSFKCRLPRYYKDKIFSDDEKDIIRQLYIIKNKPFTQQDFYKLSEKELHDINTKELKFKRDYKNKCIKNRKDL